jgi:branched-chain amino acid transport system substrate-binding protein
MKRKAASSGLAIALLVVGLLVGAGLTYAVTSSSSASTSTSTVTSTVGAGATVTSTATVVSTSTVTVGGSTGSSGLSGTVTIGDLTDLSGQLSAIGTQQKVSINLAITDINNYLAATGQTNVKFAAAHEDTGLNPATALTDLQTLASDGVQVVVGPLTSSEASNVLQYADQNHIVLISPSSTAISLAIPNDYLFRLVPNDGAQSFAIARELVSENVKDIVVINQQSAYGTGLANATINRFEALGGNVQDEIQYSSTATDFTPTLTQTQTDYQTAVAKYGASSVAVLAIGFQEVGQMLIQAKSSFPNLLSANWYGSDGESQNTDFTNSTSAVAPIATQVKLISTIGLSAAASAKTNAFDTEFTAADGQAPDSYAINAYDATWIAALSVLAAGQNNGPAIQKALPTVADNYFGASGWTQLQPSGDEAPVGYSIYEVVTQGGTTQWVLAGTYSTASDAVTWNSGYP